MEQKKGKKRKELQKLEKKNQENKEKLIKDRMIENIRAVFENEEEHCYKPKRVSCFRKNNYTEHEINGDKNSNFSLDEYLNKIKHYLRNIITDLQNSDTFKNHLTIAINFKSSKDAEE